MQIVDVYSQSTIWLNTITAQSYNYYMFSKSCLPNREVTTEKQLHSNCPPYVILALLL